MNGFIFDMNKCVACHACVVACQIENGAVQHLPWREISTFNAFQHPDLPVFHFSLACNHCEDAPCMKNCPALAYSKNGDKNLIVHDANACIGCKYCTWACPYDAPKFVASTGVVEKCTMCTHRLDEDLKPACANLCPTGALDFNALKAARGAYVAGFTEAGINPGIEIIPLRNKAQGPENHQSLSADEQALFKKLSKSPLTKVTLREEWPLLVFTLLAAVLTGLIYASYILGPVIGAWPFFAAGVFGVLLSAAHLGKKFRAWSAIFNLRGSWLSREIFFYGLFLLSGIIFLFFPALREIGLISVVAGLFALFSMDKLYALTLSSTPFPLNSASVLFSGLLFTSLFLQVSWFFELIVIIKLGLYSYRKYYFYKNGRNHRPWLSLIRILIGLILPLILAFIDFSTLKTPIFVFVLIGELIDRIEFYEDMEVITPKRQIEMDLMEELNC